MMHVHYMRTGLYASLDADPIAADARTLLYATYIAYV